MSQTCNKCGSENAMSNEQMAMMPIAQHEKDQNRLMEIIKSLVAIIVVLIVLLVGSNLAWIIYESQFEVVEENTTITQDNENGYNNYIGNDGDINYGETDHKNQQEIPQKENG